MKNESDVLKLIRHMRELGLMTLGRAACEVTFSEMMRPYAHALAVGIAAHGAEIVLKSRIAEKDPLAIFKTIPKTSAMAGQPAIEELLEYGRTIQYSDIPRVMLTTVGIEMKRVEQYLQFGRLRYRVLHLGAPDADYSAATHKFIFEVMEPLVNEFWNESIVPYVGEYDETAISDGYLTEVLNNCGVKVSEGLQARLEREKD